MSSTSDQTPNFENLTMVLKKVLPDAQGEGVGAIVRRSIGRYKIDKLLFFFITFFLLNEKFSYGLIGDFRILRWRWNWDV